MNWLARESVRQVGWFLLLASAIPVLTFCIPTGIVWAAGCNALDEAGVTQCIVLGINMTAPLTVMTLMGVVFSPALLLAPVGVLAIVASWIAVALTRD